MYVSLCVTNRNKMNKINNTPVHKQIPHFCNHKEPPTINSRIWLENSDYSEKNTNYAKLTHKKAKWAMILFLKRDILM